MRYAQLNGNSGVIRTAIPEKFRTLLSLRFLPIRT